MRTPKIEALHRLIDWINARSTPNRGESTRAAVSNDGYVIPKLDLDNSPLNSNPWLAGFIESDGNFYCGFEMSNDGIAKRVKCYMRISQKISYKLNAEIPESKNSNFYIMEKIRKFLSVKNVTEIKKG